MALDIKSFEIENPKGLYDPRQHGYSHMATVPSGSTLIFVSGQGGFNGDEELSKDFKTQVVNSYKNLSIALGSKGLTLQHKEFNKKAPSLCFIFLVLICNCRKI